ncbi:hypothetical protein N7526_000795 [Penicillium atrosanguineum]|nr:hypothetical protein N7526_000795 [Penicillium atrosanguineum]
MSLSTRDSTYDAGPQLLRDIWGLTAVAIVVVFLRIVAKYRIRKFGADDLLMAFALCMALVGSIMITLAIQLGFGQKVSALSDAAVSKVIMHDYLSQTFGLAGGTIGRISFIVFVIGLLAQRSSQKIALWTLAGAQVVVNSLLIIIIFVQCPGHASAIWSHSGKEKCWSLKVQADYGYFQGAFNAATDLGLATFSTYIFWNLNLKLRVKAGLVVLLGLGIFAMIAAIIKTVQTRVLASSDNDPTIATVTYDRWLFIETYLVIVTTSIPSIRSLFRSMDGRKIGRYDTGVMGSVFALDSFKKDFGLPTSSSGFASTANVHVSSNEDNEEVQREIAEIFAAIEEETAQTEGVTWKECLQKSNRYRFFLDFIIMFWQQFSGTNSIGYSTKSLLFATGVYGTVKAVATVIFLLISIDRWGRKLSMFSGAACMAAMTFIIGAVYLGEILPTRLRAYGVGLGATSQWLFSFVITEVTPRAINSVEWRTCLMFAILCTAMGIFVSIVVKKTKGRTLEDMDLIFGAIDEEQRQVVENTLHKNDIHAEHVDGDKDLDHK